MQHKGVMKAAMKLLGTHINIFKKHVTKHSIELVTLAFSKYNNLTHYFHIVIYLFIELCINENMETRDAANEMLSHLVQ